MTTLLVDGNNLAYRVFAAYPYLSTSGGKPVAVVYGVVKLLRAALNKFNPDSIIIAWDGNPSARRLLYPEYKANRGLNRTEQEQEAYKSYRNQLIEVFAILRHMNVYQCQEPNSEADDIIALLTYDSGKYIVLSEDKDMLQLVNKNVSVYRPIKDQHYTHDNFEKLMGLTPQQFLYTRILQGDDSDNIGGIPGIGEKTAFKLIQEFKDLSALCHCAKNTPGTIMKKIVDLRPIIIRNKMLMDLRYALEMVGDNPHKHLTARSFDELKLKEVFVKYEFFSFVKSWGEFTAPFRRLT